MQEFMQGNNINIEGDNWQEMLTAMKNQKKTNTLIIPE